MWSGAGAWSHAPGRCASATTRAADQPDQPDQPDESYQPYASHADDSDQPGDPNTNESAEPSAAALTVDESSRPNWQPVLAGGAAAINTPVLYR